MNTTNNTPAVKIYAYVVYINEKATACRLIWCGTDEQMRITAGAHIQGVKLFRPSAGVAVYEVPESDSLEAVCPLVHTCDLSEQNRRALVPSFTRQQLIDMPH